MEFTTRTTLARDLKNVSTLQDRLRREDEGKLERSGEINFLQWKRWFLWTEQPRTVRSPVDILGFLKAEIALRENTQREVAIKFKLASLKTLSQSGTKRYHFQTRSLEKEIVRLGREYWFLVRERWSKRSGFHEGPLSRGINLWRSNPSWYMHHILREDCAKRGGCCGRKCDCCISRRDIPGRKFAAGHCTIQCHCCEKSRGAKLTSEDMKRLEEKFNISEKGYFQRIRDASLLGIVQGNHLDSPFELIDDPPPEYTP